MKALIDINSKSIILKIVLLTGVLMLAGCLAQRSINVEPKSITNKNEEMFCVIKKECDSAIIEAVRNGNVEKLRHLINAGADVNAREPENGEPLIMLGTSSADTIRELLSAGADVNAINYYGTTALMYAAHNGEFDSAELLLAHGAKVNWFSGSRITPLMDAAHGGNPKIIKLFLENGAEVNAVASFGVSALMKAAFNGNLEAVKALIRADADVNKKAKDGSTALTDAKDQYAETFVFSKHDRNEKQTEFSNKKIKEYMEVITFLKESGTIENPGLEIHLLHPNNDELPNCENSGNRTNLIDYFCLTQYSKHGGHFKPLWINRNILLSGGLIQKVETVPELSKIFGQNESKDNLESLRKQGFYPSVSPMFSIVLTYNDIGSKELENIRIQNNLLNQLVLLLDGKLLRAPIIITPIPGGKLRIRGQYSIEEAEVLARRIRENVGFKDNS